MIIFNINFDTNFLVRLDYKFESIFSEQDEQSTEQLAGNKEPKWLSGFLEKTFFDGCVAHPIRRNELSKYYINCKRSVCQYCMSSGAHRHHKVLKVYRHVYKDVVPLAAMEIYVDCSQIQVHLSYLISWFCTKVFYLNSLFMFELSYFLPIIFGLCFWKHNSYVYIDMYVYEYHVCLNWGHDTHHYKHNTVYLIELFHELFSCLAWHKYVDCEILNMYKYKFA